MNKLGNWSGLGSNIGLSLSAVNPHLCIGFAQIPQVSGPGDSWGVELPQTQVASPVIGSVCI